MRGNAGLAQAYAVHVESAWRHYAYRADTPYPGVFGIDYMRALLADHGARNDSDVSRREVQCARFATSSLTSKGRQGMYGIVTALVGPTSTDRSP